MNDIQEIYGKEGFYKIIPQKILYKFWMNSNFMYCQNYKTGKIAKVKEIK